MIEFIPFFLIPILIVTVFIYPLWQHEKRYKKASIWSLFIATPSIIVWLGLAVSGVGNKDWEVLFGPLFMTPVIIVLYYLKFYFSDKPPINKLINTTSVVILSCVFAALLWVYIPPMHC